MTVYGDVHGEGMTTVQGTATWVYFASAAQTDLASTLESILEARLLWRPATNSLGALIANVGNLRVGDALLLAWRENRKAYLCCRIAAPLSPVVVNGKSLVIDKVTGAEAEALTSHGYRDGGGRAVEAIRFEEIRECYFPLQGRYGGNNTLHRIDPRDEEQLDLAGPIPPSVRDRKRGGTGREVAQPSAATVGSRFETLRSLRGIARETFESLGGGERFIDVERGKSDTGEPE